MPSNQTSNYALNQWSKDDQILMDDFNADNAKIDAALAAERAAREAAVTSINTTLSGMVKLAVGSYTGDGAETRKISVGFTPKAVFVTTLEGCTYIFSDGYASSAALGGLAVTGHPCSAVEIVSGGFNVFKKAYVASNGNNNFNYIAIG